MSNNIGPEQHFPITNEVQIFLAPVQLSGSFAPDKA
jgi:hypothetical protein